MRELLESYLDVLVEAVAVFASIAVLVKIIQFGKDVYELIVQVL